MTCGQLRALTLKSVTAACPVAIVLDTPNGPVQVMVTGHMFERNYGPAKLVDGKETKPLESERMILLARASEGGAPCQ